MIYFLRAGVDGAVKIGWTRDAESLDRRIATLQTGQHQALVVVRTMDAPRWAEGWLHGFFSGLRMAGEWFRFDQQMLRLQVPPEDPKIAERRIAIENCAAMRAARRARKHEIQEAAKAASALRRARMREARTGDQLPDQGIDPVAELRAAVATAGSQAEWARDARVSVQYVCDVLAGRRPAGPAILGALGLRRVERIERAQPTSRPADATRQPRPASE